LQLIVREARSALAAALRLTTLLAFALLLGCRREKGGTPSESNGGAPGAASAVVEPAASETEEPGLPPAPPDAIFPPSDAIVTESGLSYKMLAPGSGEEHPHLEDEVMVNFTGWTPDGKPFDGTAVQGVPAKLRIGRIISGLTEGLQLMTVGAKARLWIPERLAYVDRAHDAVSPAGSLIVDVELLEIRPAPKAPPDVAGPPPSAIKTPSGLFSRVLERGKGARHPKETDKVTVQYTGWTTDGRFYATSAAAGRKPAKVRVNDVLKGLTEGLQLMVEGEKRRFWIPEELAFGLASRPQIPSGMVVFDVELIAIE
jgi:FKBP-type peptidyl-prolyl cis-trans isomerase